MEKRYYGKAGKPCKNETPRYLSYRVTATLLPNSEAIQAQRTRCGRFILATNVLDRDQLSADDALREYKA
ncbi:MAG: hypothetical protein VKJ02_17510 [Snowella sp.]|nr:hypothetical protein [Snowella sp.]